MPRPGAAKREVRGFRKGFARMFISFAEIFFERSVFASSLMSVLGEEVNESSAFPISDSLGGRFSSRLEGGCFGTILTAFLHSMLISVVFITRG